MQKNKTESPEIFQAGGAAPNFMLPDQNGTVKSLKDYNGKYLVLYFYPKDNTSGCTTEAKDFSANLDKFIKRGADVVGISPDSAASHKGFTEKQNLRLTLLSDTEKSTLKEYKAWGKKKMYGKEYEGVIRSTFLIDPAGRVVKIWRGVKVNGHVDDVLKILDENSR